MQKRDNTRSCDFDVVSYCCKFAYIVYTILHYYSNVCNVC